MAQGHNTGPPSWGSETVKYGRGFCGTSTQQGPEATVQINDRPILSSKRVPHIRKPAAIRQNTKNLIMDFRWEPDLPNFNSRVKIRSS
jgi:hypothetical protein